MSEDQVNPFDWDAAPVDPDNPYAAPQSLDAVTEQTGPELATRGSRFVGAFVDGLTMIPLVVVVVVLRLILADSGLDDVSDLFAGLAGAVLGTVWYLILNGYLLAKRGQTIGKIVSGTRIVDAESGELVPLGPLILKRWVSIQILMLLPFLGRFIGLIDALLIFRKNRRCLHDDFAGTKVIKVQNSRPLWHYVFS